MPYRIPAPPPEPPEEPYAAVLRSQGRRAKIGSILACALVVSVVAIAFAMPARKTPPHTAIETSRVDEARIAMTGARARTAAQQARFETSLRDAIGQDFVARPDLGACPVALPRPTGLGRPFPILVLTRVDIAAALPSQAVAESLASLARAEDAFATGRYEEAALAASADPHAQRRLEVVVVASTKKDPIATSGTTYEPGEIAGRAFVYDFATETVVCAADIRAKSSPQVGYAYAVAAESPPRDGRDAQMTTSLESDFRLRLELAILDVLEFRAGPSTGAQLGSRHSGL